MGHAHTEVRVGPPPGAEDVSHVDVHARVEIVEQLRGRPGSRILVPDLDIGDLRRPRHTGAETDPRADAVGPRKSVVVGLHVRIELPVVRLIAALVAVQKAEIAHEVEGPAVQTFHETLAELDRRNPCAVRRVERKALQRQDGQQVAVRGTAHQRLHDEGRAFRQLARGRLEIVDGAGVERDQRVVAHDRAVADGLRHAGHPDAEDRAPVLGELIAPVQPQHQVDAVPQRKRRPPGSRLVGPDTVVVVVQGGVADSYQRIGREGEALAVDGPEVPEPQFHAIRGVGDVAPDFREVGAPRLQVLESEAEIHAGLAGRHAGKHPGPLTGRKALEALGEEHVRMPGAGLLELEPGAVGVEVDVLPVVKIQGQDVVAGGHVPVGGTLRTDRDPESRTAGAQHAPEHGIEKLRPPGIGEQNDGRQGQGQGGESRADEAGTEEQNTHEGRSRKFGPVR